MEASNVSADAALEEVNPSGVRRMKASTAVDGVEHLHVARAPDADARKG